VLLEQAHLDAWGAEFSAADMVGLALVDEGRILALGGVRWDSAGLAWCHYDSVPDVSPLIHRAALRIAQAVIQAGETTLHATCDPSRPRARAWLERFGFVERSDGVWIYELGSAGGPRRRLHPIGPSGEAGGERGGSAA
jgi:hypothetical protein